MRASSVSNQIEEFWRREAQKQGMDAENAYAVLSSALSAWEIAYAPYSSFRVGAAVRDDRGNIYSGCNIENASFGATVCAERAAIFNMVSDGGRRIKELAVVADYPRPISPCGICRQVVAEFGRDSVILMANTAGQLFIVNFRELFPYPFDFQGG